MQFSIKISGKQGFMTVDFSKRYIGLAPRQQRRILEEAIAELQAELSEVVKDEVRAMPSSAWAQEHVS